MCTVSNNVAFTYFCQVVFGGIESSEHAWLADPYSAFVPTTKNKGDHFDVRPSPPCVCAQTAGSDLYKLLTLGACSGKLVDAASVACGGCINQLKRLEKQQLQKLSNEIDKLMDQPVDKADPSFKWYEVALNGKSVLQCVCA